MHDDVRFGSFGRYQLCTVEVAVDELDFGVLRSNFGAFVRVADKSCDLEVWVGVRNGIEDVTANIARSPSATACQSTAENRNGKELRVVNMECLYELDSHEELRHVVSI